MNGLTTSEAAERLGIDGTPAFVLNGSPVVGLQPFAVFESAARLILARAEAMPDPSRVYADMVRHPVALPEPASEGRATVDPWAGVHELPVPPTAPSRGGPSAPVVLQVFSDFECPYCARVRPTLDALRAHYGDRRGGSGGGRRAPRGRGVATGAGGDEGQRGEWEVASHGRCPVGARDARRVVNGQ